jgi:hypothetical protein
LTGLLGNKTALLEETLQSHRVAISLDPSNTDVLFNTGQVLSSLSEALLDTSSQETAKAPARAYLEEAVDIFTKCLDSQQAEYEQTQAEIAKANLEEFQEAFERDYSQRNEAEVLEQESMETSESEPESPGDWAHVIEPVTPSTILETCTAQIAALTTLLGLYDPADLASIEARAQNGLETANTKIPTLLNLIQSSPAAKPIEEPTPGPTLSIASPSTVEEPEASIENDALLAVANLNSTIAEISYRSGRSDVLQYATQIEQIFASLIQPPSDTTKFDPGYTNAISAYADAHIALASAISDRTGYTSASSTFLSELEIQWSALAHAQTLLTQLSSKANVAILSASRMTDIFAARGDVDLFRFRISLFPEAKAAWAKSRPVLVANAGVFYRGARSYAEKAGNGEVKKTADAKAVVAEVLKEVASGSEARKENWKGKGAEVKRVLEQMVEEGIVGRDEAEGVLSLVS